MPEEQGPQAWFHRIEGMVEDLHRAILGDVRTGAPGLLEGHRDHERRLTHLEHAQREGMGRTEAVERRVSVLEQAPARAAEAEVAERQEAKRLVRREWTGGIVRAIASAIVGGLIGAALMVWSVMRHVGGSLFRNGP
ncbi:hypothetical protein J7643_03820 [bacterium]|nr:hypothetical protein [bacterium]